MGAEKCTDWSSLEAMTWDIGLSRLDFFIALLIGQGINAIDNSCVTPNSLFYRFTTNPDLPPNQLDSAVHCMHDNLVFFAPFGLLFAGIYAIIEYKSKFHKRRMWDAYWQKEKEELKRLYEHLSKTRKIKRRRELTDLEEDILIKIYHNFSLYRERVKKLETTLSQAKQEIESIQTEDQIQLKSQRMALVKQITQRIKPLRKKMDALTGLFRELQINVTAEASSTRLDLRQNHLENSTHLTTCLKAEKAIAQKQKDDILSQLKSGEMTFLGLALSVPFAWAWGYWFVFFVTRWALDVNFKMVPFHFGFLALIGSVAYLLYREYCAYRMNLVVPITQAQQNELDHLIETKANERLINRTHEEFMQNNLRENAKQLRWHRIFGWGFVAVITGISSACLSGLPLLGALGLGFGIAFAVAFISYTLTSFLDAQIRRKRNTLAKEQREHVSKTIKYTEKFGLHRIENPHKKIDSRNAVFNQNSIVLIGKGDERTVYFIQEGQWVFNDFAALGERPKPRFVKIRLSELTTAEEKKDPNFNDTQLDARIKKAALTQAGLLPNQLPNPTQCLANKQEQKQMLFLAHYRLGKLNALYEAFPEIVESRQAGIILTPTLPLSWNLDQESIEEIRRLQEEVERLEKLEKDENKENILRLRENIKNLEEKSEPIKNRYRQRIKDLQKKSISHPQVEQWRKYLVAFFGFFVGVMLGCILAFPLTDFISNVSTTLFAFTPDGMGAEFIYGGFSLMIGGVNARRQWLNENAHSAELQIQRADPEYIKKLALLEVYQDEIKRLKSEMMKDDNRCLLSQASLDDLLAKPTKARFTREKVKKVALWVARVIFKILTDVSSVILMARALLMMGFVKLALPLMFPMITNTAATGLFGMFCAGGFAANPLGIAVLALALTFLLLRTGLDLYFAVKKEHELERIAKIDTRLYEKKAEYEHVFTVDKVLKRARVIEKEKEEKRAKKREEGSEKVEERKKERVKERANDSDRDEAPLVDIIPGAGGCILIR